MIRRNVLPTHCVPKVGGNWLCENRLQDVTSQTAVAFITNIARKSIDITHAGPYEQFTHKGDVMTPAYSDKQPSLGRQMWTIHIPAECGGRAPYSIKYPESFNSKSKSLGKHFHENATTRAQCHAILLSMRQ